MKPVLHFAVEHTFASFHQLFATKKKKNCPAYQSRNVRYLGIVTDVPHRKWYVSGGNAMVTPTQAFEWSAKAHACSAKEMTVASVLLIAQALF